MFVHKIILNSTYRLFIDELFFYFGDLFESTKFVRDYSRIYVCVYTNVYSASGYECLIYSSKYLRKITYD